MEGEKEERTLGKREIVLERTGDGSIEREERKCR